MSLEKTNLHILQQAQDLRGRASSGVSMHCHTEHSREMLDFVPHYADKLPVINFFWKRERKKYIKREGRLMAFDTGFWSPPLTASEVFGIEQEQINKAGLDAMVSLTDHDSIDANLKVNELSDNKTAPISLEWTVPFEFGFFHIGVHNLPKDDAVDLTKTLLDYTFTKERHSNENLREMFEMLNNLPGVLVIFNHPIWDIELVGQERHNQLLKRFLEEHGQWIHAFEVNGFRSWSENKAVIEMARSLGYPLVTGGDRHGCQPNTVLNLTNAKTFSEFVEEIRVDKHSEVVLMPEYSQPLHSRQMQSFSEILKFYPEFPEGRKQWFDRVHFDVLDGEGVRPVSIHWDKGGPMWLRMAIWTLGVLGHRRARPVFRLVEKKKDRVPSDLKKAGIAPPEVPDTAVGVSAEPPQTKTKFAS